MSAKSRSQATVERGREPHCVPPGSADAPANGAQAAAGSGGSPAPAVDPQRREQRLLLQPTIQILGDLLMLEAAFLTTYWFRFHAGLWPVPLGIPPFHTYLVTSFVILLVFFGIFYASGMYTARGWRSLEEDLIGLFKGVVLGSLLVLAMAFFFRHMTYSRSFFGLFFLSCFLFLTVGRAVTRRLLRLVLRRGRGSARVLLVGDNPMRERILRAVRELPGLALQPVGWVRVTGDASVLTTPSKVDAAGTEGRRADTGAVSQVHPGPEPVEGLPCLGGVAGLREIIAQRDIDLVVLTLPFAQLSLVGPIAELLDGSAADLQFVPDLLALRTSRMRLTEIAGIPFVSVREVALSGADRIVKRTFDLVASAASLILLAPLFVLLALLVKLSSSGPVFYRQARVGRDGREFAMIKFRSMRQGAEAGTGPVWTTSADPRVTGLGRFLRRTSLDELPQLWNVLRGEMSLVGPRPERQHFVEQFRRRLPRYFERHRVRSGLTGWAQVHGLRGNTSIEERTLYDLYYVENWSLALDIKIILMTLHHLLRGENAY